ncbi:hypothetical protein LIER_09742 [Lithospermum erythrorhizon]|uniref:Uncharacterized protein n=1 Tax=Lithospermum erythrorhizon TaxID=34254 RepID=A0AAV3PJS7_LITER
MLTCKSDESVFYKRSGVGIILLVVYVDAIVITRSDCVCIASLKSFLQDQFLLKIWCFSDSDWARSKIDRRFTTGYCVFVGGNLVSWKSKKHNVISLSSAETEYRAMVKSTCEIMWIFHFLNEIGIEASIPDMINIYDPT